MSERFLIMEFAGPTMSFGGPSIDGLPDEIGHPTHSMVVGLIANALGLTQRDGHTINRIQEKTSLAVGIVKWGERIVDFQTADLTTPHMIGPMWTGQAKLFTREGSKDAITRQIRYRPIIADGHFVGAVSLTGECGFSLDAILQALNEPARPLFIGRAGNIPTSLIGHSIQSAQTAVEAMRNAGFQLCEAKVPTHAPSGKSDVTFIPGRKDFVSGIHSGNEVYEGIKLT